jgi:hypothetical protein
MEKQGKQRVFAQGDCVVFPLEQKAFCRICGKSGNPGIPGKQ